MDAGAVAGNPPKYTAVQSENATRHCTACARRPVPTVTLSGRNAAQRDPPVLFLAGTIRNRIPLSESFSPSQARSARVFSLPTSFFPSTAESNITGSPEIGSRSRLPLSHSASNRTLLPAYSMQRERGPAPFFAVMSRTVIYTAMAAVAAAPTQMLLWPVPAYTVPPLPKERTAVISPPSSAPHPQIKALCLSNPRNPPHFPKARRHMRKLAPAANMYSHGPWIPITMLTTAYTPPNAAAADMRNARLGLHPKSADAHRDIKSMLKLMANSTSAYNTVSSTSTSQPGAAQPVRFSTVQLCCFQYMFHPRLLCLYTV